MALIEGTPVLPFARNSRPAWPALLQLFRNSVLASMVADPVSVRGALSAERGPGVRCIPRFAINHAAHCVELPMMGRRSRVRLAASMSLESVTTRRC
jgi:hypothetical protein